MSTRREFFTQGAVGGAVMTAAGLMPRTIYAAVGDDKKIRYRDLGSTGWKATEVSFGAMNMRDVELVRAALDAGVNYVDTAHGYMNGVNEEVVGQAIKGRRDDVFLVTKVSDSSPEGLTGKMELSLKRLGVDHVDLALYHNRRSPEDISADWVHKTFDSFREKGYTRFVGYSTHDFNRAMADATLKVPFWQAVLFTYNYTSSDEIRESCRRAREAGLATIAMKTLLHGKVEYDAPAGTTVNQAAIKWVLTDNNVDTVISGVTTFEQLTEDLAVMGMALTSREEKALRRYGKSLEGTYCRGVTGCTGCREQCPYGVAVHEINRCLGYAVGYGDERLAWENYRALPAGTGVERCGDCSECVVKCVHGLNLTANIRRARSLFA